MKVFSLIRSDFNRFQSKREALMSASFAVTFWFRICQAMYRCNRLTHLLGIPFFIGYKLLNVLTGIQLPINTQVGRALRFFHYGMIVTAGTVKYGDNVSIHQGVTLGRVFNGKNAGVPTVGNNVVIFPGAVVVGNVHIGDNAVIQANALVIKDVPQGCVVGGVPAKVLSEDSSKCFDDKWRKWFGF